MLDLLGYDSLDALIDATVPAGIRFSRPLAIHAPMSEHEALANLRAIARKNQVFRSYLGLGYYDCITPPVIQRNILENPGWYTAYTPYQAEIAQGRLEALLNFQTMVIDLTGLEIANASLLDEGTAAAEAMAMSYAARGKPGKETFFISDDCHPQTIDVVKTRAHARGVDVVVGDWRKATIGDDVFGALLQYPATDGARLRLSRSSASARTRPARWSRSATDLMSLVLLTPPGEWGADVCVGNSQRFGVPLGYGGPHAAFFATKDEFKRQLPGRIIGVSRDADGKPALRMALQTREQHIRREKATSNVCTAQVLLAVIAGMYAVWHGPERLTAIARAHPRARGDARRGTRAARLHARAATTTSTRSASSWATAPCGRRDRARREARDQPARAGDVARRHRARRDRDGGRRRRAAGRSSPRDKRQRADVRRRSAPTVDARYDERFARTTPFLTHPVFNSYHSETEMLRYLKRLENKDLSLTTR